jgi:5-methylcytosine-specific restriction enzyme subunit McrC
LLEAVVPAFVAQVRRAGRRGRLHGYRSVEATLPLVRGRLRLDAQLRDHFGRVPPAEVRYDDFTVDVEENRLLKAALTRLGRLRLRSAAVARMLGQALARFEGVTDVRYDPRALPEVRYTRLNAHYRPAVELARRLLRATAFDLSRGRVTASSFLVDMNVVFEDFVVVALREALGLTPGAFPQGAAGKEMTLDRAGSVRLRPDLSWWDGPDCTFVGDVKYKRTGAPGVEHPDLYQLLAYTVATGLPAGLLIYAAGEAEPVSHVVEPGKELQVTALDLAGTPETVLQQIDTLAARVRRLRRRALDAPPAAHGGTG